MELIYRNRKIKPPAMYLLIFLFVLLTNGMLLLILYGDRDVAAQAMPFKVLAGITILISILNFPRYPMIIKKFLIIVVILLVIVAIESYGKYYTFFKYPHVFSKLILIFYFFLPYVYFLKNPEHRVRNIVYLIIIVALINIIFFNSHILSMSSFLQTERGLEASSVYLLLFPCLFFFNKYIEKDKFIYLISFFAVLFLIIFLQHRSVWIATTVALTINFLLSRNKTENKIKFASLSILILILTIALMIISSLVISKNPEVIDKFSDRFSDIVNYKTQGTGGWRYAQFSSYMPFIKDNLLYGMRLEGFELPIQFYDHNNNQPWEDGTGHHIHSFYVDTLFYFGIIGLIILMFPIIIILRMALKIKSLDNYQIGMISYVLSGIIYGLSYNLPDFYFAIVGITFASIYQNYVKENELSDPGVKDEKKYQYST
jgi:hypothetical protein